MRSSPTRRVVWWALGCVLATGCSHDAVPGEPGDARDLGGAAPTDAFVLDLAAPTDAAPAVDLADRGDGGPFFTGSIDVRSRLQGLAGATTTRGSVTAFLYSLSQPYDCPTPVRFGDCDVGKVGTCPLPGDRVEVSAGDLSFLGVPVFPLTLVFANGHYSSFDEGMPPFTGGERIHIRADGADVPAFQATLQAPAAAVVTAPTLSIANGNYTLEVDRSVELPIEWNGLPIGELKVALVDDQSNYIFCSFPGNAGAGVVPKAALSLLAPGGARLDVDGWDEQYVRWGRSWIHVHSRVTARTLDGGAYASSRLTLRP